MLRGGTGIFYGLGDELGVQGTIAFPYARSRTLFGAECGCGGTASFPLSPADGAPIPYSLNPPHTFLFAFDPHLKDPRVYYDRDCRSLPPIPGRMRPIAARV